MRSLCTTLLAVGLIGIAAAPGVAAELKAEGNEPGLSVLIQDLKRDEANSVTLRFQLVNDADKTISLHGKFEDHEAKGRDSDEVGGVHLIDNANKKKYLVVRDSNGKCACDENRQSGEGRQSQSLGEVRRTAGEHREGDGGCAGFPARRWCPDHAVNTT
jgi:hypothetical protein